MAMAPSEGSIPTLEFLSADWRQPRARVHRGYFAVTTT